MLVGFFFPSFGREWRKEKGGETDRVKMALVTAAIEYVSRRARQRASMRAVLPEPTGLWIATSVVGLAKEALSAAEVLRNGGVG